MMVELNRRNHFLSENISWIKGARDMVQGDLVCSEGTTNSDLANIQVAKLFGDGTKETPVDSPLVVGIDNKSWCGNSKRLEITKE